MNHIKLYLLSNTKNAIYGINNLYPIQPKNSNINFNIITDRTEPILTNKEILLKEFSEDTCKNKTLHIFMQVEKLLEHIPIKYHSTISTLHNKQLFNEFMIKNNLEQHIPQILSFPPKEFPCIIKPIISLGGDNTYIIKNINDYHKYKHTPKKYIIQKYIISNNIYTCHILSNNGIFRLGKVYHKTKPEKYYIQRGPMQNYISRNLNDNELLLFSKILEISNYHGICCIDYDYDENNIIKIFEMNPRIGGSLIHNNHDVLEFFKIMLDEEILYI